MTMLLFDFEWRWHLLYVDLYDSSLDISLHVCISSVLSILALCDTVAYNLRLVPHPTPSPTAPNTPMKPIPNSSSTMDNAYILQMTDRTEEDYIMPTFSPDPHPHDSRGPVIVIRVISPNTDPTCSMEFDTTWELMRRKSKFSSIMAAGQGYWWEEKGKWLHPEETPDQVSREIKVWRVKEVC
jgi:hypothetical protein